MPRRARFAAVLALAALGGMLQGCVGMVAGAAATSATAASQERGLGGAISDTEIRANINRQLFDHDIKLMNDVGLSVVEGRVLLTGTVASQQARLDAVRLAWQARGVREVINELKIGNEGGITSYARDTLISTRLKTEMLFDKEIQAINYSIETVEGVVYLMGIAQNAAELDRVTNRARNLSYVRKVVSYVRLKDDPRRQGQ